MLANQGSFGARFGLLMARVRGDLGLTQEDLADQVFGSRSRDGDISKLENGNVSRPQQKTIAAIAGALGIDNAEIEALRHSVQNDAPEIVQRLLAQIEGLGEKLKLSHALVVALAYNYGSGSSADFDSALRDLENALRIAAADRAKLSSNLGEAVDQVIAKVNVLNDAGDIPGGTKALKAAMGAQKDKLAEAEQGYAALLAKGVAQAVLERSVPDAVAFTLERLARDVPDRAERFEALRAEWLGWYARGRDKGLGFDLEVAIALARQTLMRAEGPDERGTASNDLGVVLQTLGERDSGTGRLEAAVEAYEAALLENTRERVPLDWARTQNNLGNVMSILGQRECGNTRLEAAVRAYEAALQQYSQELEALNWATTQNNLGEALRNLGERENGTMRLDAAVRAFEAALLVRTREQVPLDWAGTQNNLGNALRSIGEREHGTIRLEAAIRAYEAAMLERTRQKVPLQWAMTQNNLGVALQTLGVRESGTVRLEAAVQAYEAALLEWTRDRVPLEWAMTQNNLGNVLCTLGGRERGSVRLEAAVGAYEAALLEWTRVRVPLKWAMAQENLAIVELALARHVATVDRGPHLARALAHVTAALEVYDPGQTLYYHEQAVRLRDHLLAALAVG